MKPIRFVHSADLHLDAPFKGLHDASPKVGRVLREATFTVYERIIDLCIEREVDALLVAGDVYDGADRSLLAQLRFVEGLERLEEAGIRSFICHGNHDPLDGWTASLDLPPGCTRFSDEPSSAPLTAGGFGAVIGMSHCGAGMIDELIAGFPSPGPGFTVGLLHGDTGSRPAGSNAGTVTVEALIRSGIDYWALGHVHARQVLHESNPAILYPGNPQGLQPNETGPRGVYLVDVDERGAVRTEFVPVCAVRWERPVVDIGGIETEQELLDATRREVERMVADAGGCDIVFRLELRGQGPLHRITSGRQFLHDLRDHLNAGCAGREPFAWCDAVSALTLPEIDRTARREAGDLLATVLRLTDAIRTDPGPLVTLREDLEPLFAHPRLAPYREEIALSDETLLDLVKAAEAQIIASLIVDQ